MVQAAKPKNKITPTLRAKGMVVPIASVKLDPLNAREHPEENVRDIARSLAKFGQRSPIIVRAENRTVAKGNGTTLAALSMGWTEIAADFQPMTDAEFWGYALADNRTGETSKWNLEAVAALEQLLREAGEQDGMIGWTAEQIANLRAQAEMEAYAPDGLSGEQSWQDLWVGMPEFVQEDQTSYRSIIVHFKDETAVKDFEELIGYSLDSTFGGAAGKCIWFPQEQVVWNKDKRYRANGQH